ncbi:MAG: ABC transporter ATP-binding protein [Cyclobacteriaceae bacterium]|nr:ABC transporter ATP-binding protein [Cyclobacteriaceae bacterium]
MTLQARHISKAHGTTPVLHDLTFTIEKGEFVALVGPSGAGKTTLLKILAGLLAPDQGELSLDGVPVDSPKNKLVAGHENIRMVFQDFSLKHKMTVEENLNYALLGYEPAYKKYRIDQLLDLCHLTPFRLRFPEELSGGQQQRVAFARALATAPDVILMDEPFSNLDPVTKQQLLQEARLLARETNTGILLVTHDTRDALEAADRILVLINGKIVQDAPPLALYRQPASPDVARLLGYINVVSADTVNLLSPATHHPAGTYGLWAENIRQGPDGTGGILQQVIFKGPYHLVEVQLANGATVWSCDFSKSLQAGRPVDLTLTDNSIIRFD